MLESITGIEIRFKVWWNLLENNFLMRNEASAYYQKCVAWVDHSADNVQWQLGVRCHFRAQHFSYPPLPEEAFISRKYTTPVLFKRNKIAYVTHGFLSTLSRIFSD